MFPVAAILLALGTPTDNAEPEHRLGIVLHDEPGLSFRDEPADSPHSTGGLNVMLRPIEVHKVPIESVSDASGLSELIEKGVFSADDVAACLAAGAATVQIYSALIFNGPGVVGTLVRGLRDRLRASGSLAEEALGTPERS